MSIALSPRSFLSRVAPTFGSLLLVGLLSSTATAAVVPWHHDFEQRRRQQEEDFWNPRSQLWKHPGGFVTLDNRDFKGE